MQRIKHHVIVTHRALRLAAFALFMLLCPLLQAQDVQGKIEQVLKSSDLGGATYGVVFYDLTNQSLLGQINAATPLVPASNMKLLTTAAAVHYLGSEFAFETQILLDGSALLIRGDGDPGFGDPNLLEEQGKDVEDFLADIVAAVKKADLNDLSEIIIDDRIFDRVFVHPNWPRDQLIYWYSAQVAGLNFNDNVLDIYAKPTQRGQAPVITYKPLNPPAHALNLNNRAVTGTRNAFWASRELESNKIMLRGTVRHELLTPIYVTIHDPALFFGQMLRERLIKAGVKVGPVNRIPDDRVVRQTRQILSVRTPLKDILARCNKDSQNLFAEALFKRLGRHVTGERGSWSNGAAAMRTFLSQDLDLRPMDITAAVIDDGSGLSKENRVSPALITQVLAKTYADPKLRDQYLESMAQPGEPGTLNKRADLSKLTGRLYAKTGTLSGTISLSGYLVYADRQVAFSFIINDYKKPGYQARQIIDKVVVGVDEMLAAVSKPLPPAPRPATSPSTTAPARQPRFTAE